MNAMLESGETLYARMGRLMGLPMNTEADAFRTVKDGVSAETYERVAKLLKFPNDLVGAGSTVRRRIAQHETFPQAESERIIRVIRVFLEAEQVYQDEATTLQWFTTPSDFVPGEPKISPMELAVTDVGARILESRIRKTVNGIY